MTILAQIGWLMRKELLMEWRQKHAISSILLYVLTTVFIVYASLQNVGPQLWNALFWIVVLFATVNAVVKSFQQENGQRQLYYYSLAHPIAIYTSKVVYNFLLLWLICWLSLGSFIFVAGNPIETSMLFFAGITVGALSLSVVFTFISSIAAKAQNTATFVAILGFPVVLPVLLLLIRNGAGALGFLVGGSPWADINLLLGIDFVLFPLGMILFPFVWRD